jgi:hypothetical protein
MANNRTCALTVGCIVAVVCISLMNSTTTLKAGKQQLSYLQAAGGSMASIIAANYTNIHRASGISIVVELTQDNLGSDLSRLAFAKMLQLEALRLHNLETELVLSTEPNVLLRDCFSAVVQESRILPDRAELSARIEQQRQMLGSRAVLLEPTGDVWEDGLELLKRQSPQLNGAISLPFIYLERHQSSPRFHQWRRLRELVEFIRINEAQCCTLPSPLLSDSLLLLEDDTKLEPDQAPLLFKQHDKQWDQITIVQTNATGSPYYAPFRNTSFVAIPIHQDIPGGRSAVARYCFAQHTSREIVGLWEDSPLTMWAAFTNHYLSLHLSSGKSTSIRLFGNTLPPEVSYDADDPRSLISIELFSSLAKESHVLDKPRKEIVESGTVPTSAATTELPAASANSRTGPLGTPTNPITIIIHLSGEMGNQMSKIVYGYSLKWMLQEEHNVSTEILLQHQALSKWRKAAMNVQRCLPVTQPWAFDAANTDEFEVRKQQQLEWMGGNFEYFHLKNPCEREECILEKVGFIAKNVNNRSGIPTIEDNWNISLPFISSDEYATISYFNNKYYPRIKEFFRFDTDKEECCLDMAEPDESVFHIRHFLGEMPKRGKRNGYEELSPHKFATELFGSLKPGDKVAFTSRFPKDFMVNFTSAFESRGIKVRFIEGQSPTQDFCFLLSARKDFAGCATSSYAAWAAYLGNATTARLYSVKSSDRIARMGEEAYFLRYNWTDPTLKTRVLFEEYNSEEQDEVDKKKKKK